MKKSGISLIVLIITIIVVIILAAVVILTLSKNNPIESAKEARFKEDVRTFQDELALYISKQYANAGGHWDGSITAKTYDEIVEYIPSFTKKYEGKFVINNNNLEYTNKVDEKEKGYAQSLNLKKYSILPSEYQQVEYIESSVQKPYIDTKYFLKNYSKIEVKFSIESGNKNSVFGTREGSVAYMLLQASNFNRMLYFYHGNDNFKEIKQPQYGKIYISTSENGSILISDLGDVSFNNQEFSLNNSMYMFAFNESGTPNFISTGTRIYYFKVFENNSLVHNYIPCYSTTTVSDVNGKQCPSQTKGFYDTVEGKFYTNQGTGEDFIPGPDVN